MHYNFRNHSDIQRSTDKLIEIDIGREAKEKHMPSGRAFERSVRIGISAFAWTAEFRTSHLEILPRLREHGLTAFEIPMFDPATLPAKGIRIAMDRNEIVCSVCAILPKHVNPISPDASVRKGSVAHLLKCVEVAAEMGAKLIAGPVYAPIGYFSGKRRTDDEWKWALAVFQELAPTLDANKVDLSIEPVNRSETHFLRTIGDAVSFCEVLDHPRIGITMDTFHGNIEEKNLCDAIRVAGKRLKHTHLSENHRGLLGTGHVDFPAVLRSLIDIEFAGSLMIEGFGYSSDEPSAPGMLWGDQNVSPEDVAFRGAQYLRSLSQSIRTA